MAPSTRGFGYWAVVVLAFFMALFGLPIFLGGLWLIVLGGSWYYALAGLGLLVSAFFLFRQSIMGVWVYLVTYAGTLAWALWEAGLDGWAQVPRLVAPTLVLVLVLLVIPLLRDRRAMPRGAFTAAMLGIVALGISALTVRETTLVAQEADAPPAAPAQVAPQEPGQE